VLANGVDVAYPPAHAQQIGPPPWPSNERPARHRSGAASNPGRTSRLHG